MSLRDQQKPQTRAPGKVDRLIAGDGEDAATLSDWLHDPSVSSNEIARRMRRHARVEGDFGLSVSESSVMRWRDENGIRSCR